MNETHFKTLMHLGTYVDANRLQSGIYQIIKPYLYPKDTTIDMFEQQGRKLKDMVCNQVISENYFENLKQCELVDITISIGKVYTEDEVSELLSVQRENCYVAIFNETNDKKLGMLAINAPVPSGGNFKKIKMITKCGKTLDFNGFTIFSEYN